MRIAGAVATADCFLCTHSSVQEIAIKKYLQMLLLPLEEALLIDGDTPISDFVAAFLLPLLANYQLCVLDRSQTCGLERQTTFSAVQPL